MKRKPGDLITLKGGWRVYDLLSAQTIFDTEVGDIALVIEVMAQKRFLVVCRDRLGVIYEHYIQGGDFTFNFGDPNEAW